MLEGSEQPDQNTRQESIVPCGNDRGAAMLVIARARDTAAAGSGGPDQNSEWEAHAEFPSNDPAEKMNTVIRDRRPRIYGEGSKIEWLLFLARHQGPQIFSEFMDLSCEKYEPSDDGSRSGIGFGGRFGVWEKHIKTFLFFSFVRCKAQIRPRFHPAISIACKHISEFYRRARVRNAVRINDNSTSGLETYGTALVRVYAYMNLEIGSRGFGGCIGKELAAMYGAQRKNGTMVNGESGDAELRRCPVAAPPLIGLPVKQRRAWIEDILQSLIPSAEGKPWRKNDSFGCDHCLCHWGVYDSTGLADVRRALLSGAPFGHHLKEVGSPLTRTFISARPLAVAASGSTPPFLCSASSLPEGISCPTNITCVRFVSCPLLRVLIRNSPLFFLAPRLVSNDVLVPFHARGGACGPTASAMEAGRRPARCAEERSPAQKCEYERASEQTRLSHLTALFPGYVTLAVLDDSIIAPVALSETSSRARPRAHPSAIPINVGAEMHRAQASEWYVCLGVGPRAFALRVGIPFEQVEVRVDGARDPGEGRELRSGER
ncbi:hypothetical protein B0H17DRAFT_1150945 [Mycena rosella]|uniref:Uncharacterized protein n=1 Tax=Mycena rosella TaxID=1033263 RepID=A0AAD7BPK8_MYCRO|nr:hypothetical protein B0H17DRAFT_1150945 [Mycena rosella]